MLVHRCDRCCVYKKEIQPCRTKYRGIWAILMHKMIFRSESCNSVSNGTFCEFRPLSVISEMFSPRTPVNHFGYPSLGSDGLEELKGLKEQAEEREERHGGEGGETRRRGRRDTE